MALAENASNDSAQSPAWSTKPSPLGDRGERLGEAARLAREHERRDRAQLGERGVERGGVGPVGLLRGGERAPAVG